MFNQAMFPSFVPVPNVVPDGTMVTAQLLIGPGHAWLLLASLFVLCGGILWYFSRTAMNWRCVCNVAGGIVGVVGAVPRPHSSWWHSARLPTGRWRRGYRPELSHSSNMILPAFAPSGLKAS